GTEGLFEDDKAEAAAPAAASAKPALKVAAKAPEQKSGNGAVIGIGIAILGLAAAFAITMKDKPKPPERATSPVVAEVKAAPTAEAKQAPTVAPTATAVAEAAPSSTAEADKPADIAKVPAGPSGAGTGPLPTKDTDDGKLAQAPKGAPSSSGKPGDLQSEMARAVGADGQPKKGDNIPEPAAGGPRNQNIPEQPSQGAVQGAITAVMGGAKACVSGADDVSRAQVTFSSAGNVTSVSVTGWAAAHGKSGCVQAALKGAKVGPFSKASFTVGVPIRP